MVKNVKGGNKSKNVARKHMSSESTEKRVLRISTSELEQYGVVCQMNGHGMFYVMTEQGNRYLGRIRSKFSGKSMRQNVINKGSIILVGMREWEKPNYKEVDLLEIYDANEVKQLHKIPTINMSVLDRFVESMTLGKGGGSTESAATVDDGSGITFSNDIDETEEDYMASIMNTKLLTASSKADAAKAEEIAFDEI
jgi:initiation factor 1A